jgi:hypothetical protein
MIREAAVTICVGALVSYPASACGQGRSAAPLAETRLAERSSVGVIDGNEEQIFGRIADVRAAPDGSFFLLDEQSAALAWFDVNGRYRGAIRSRGAGPGELAAPRAMDAMATGKLLVIDPRNGRYTFYQYAASGLTYRESFRSPSSSATSGRHVCSVGDRIYVRFLHGDKLIHEITATGSLVASFEPAEPTAANYGPATAMVSAQRSSGHLRCIANPPMIVSFGRYSPAIRAYTLDGRLLWESRPQDLRPLAFLPDPQGGVRFQSHQQGSHLGESVVRWSPQTLLVQYSITWPANSATMQKERDFYSIESRELALSNGREIGRTRHLPLIVDSQNGWLYSFENLPFPRARVLTKAR